MSKHAPHAETLQQWLDHLADEGGPGPAGLLRRLLPLVDADIDAADRLALHRRLWALWAEADGATRLATATGLDGRHAPWCDWMHTPWHAPATWLALARAHLDGSCGAPLAPGYVLALLDSHEPHPAPLQPAARWLRLRARLSLDDADLAPATAAGLVDEVLEHVRRGTLPWPTGMATVFEIAVRCGADELAARTLEACVIGRPGTHGVDGQGTPGDDSQGGAAAIAPAWFCRWLGAGQPLQLRAPLQAHWLQPARLRDPGWRRQLFAALQREAPRQRLLALHLALEQALGQAPAPPPDAPPTHLAWRGLRTLDRAYALAEQGALTTDIAHSLMTSGMLPPDAAAALCRALALQALDAGDAQAAAAALAQARLATPDAQARHWLADLLMLLLPQPAADLADLAGLAGLAEGAEEACARAAPPHPAQALAGLLRAGSDGTPDGPEWPLWQALQHCAGDAPGSATLREIATAMLARAHLHGWLQAGKGVRRADLPRAAALWQALAGAAADACTPPDGASPAGAAAPATAANATGHATALHDEARRALASAPLQHWLPRQARGPAPGHEPHLWVEPGGTPTGELLVVLSCLDSRHGYAQVERLRAALPGHHLLFVNNPAFDWYSDASFDALVALVEQRVLPHFGRDRVSCHFGSMGGHGALKLALQFGFRAVVFNPQVDLDLWALFRPHERQRLWAAGRHARPGDWPAQAWADAPLYLAVGSGTADRLALGVLIDQLRRLHHGQFIVEKFADPVHAGLVRRIALDGNVPRHVDLASRRLAVLRALPDDAAALAGAGLHELPHAARDEFWRTLDDACQLKLEIVLRGGRLYRGGSTGCGTR
ncbi:MAG: hypothetical protein RLZZ584_2644 [Pseudomonadota bacterium]